MKVLFILITSLAVLGILGWVGLKIKPAPFPTFPQQTPPLPTTTLPAGLPALVARFYRLLYGVGIPLMQMRFPKKGADAWRLPLRNTIWLCKEHELAHCFQRKIVGNSWSAQPQLIQSPGLWRIPQ